VVVLSVLSSTLRPQLTGDAQGWVQKPFNENLLFAELGRVLHHGEGPAYVLLVEDDEDLASVLTASFQDAAVRIDHVSSRQQAIRQCITRPPDLLILDLTLPDGEERPRKSPGPTPEGCKARPILLDETAKSPPLTRIA